MLGRAVWKASCYLLFSLHRQDHPEVCWRNITPAPGPELRHWPRLHSETDNRPRRGRLAGTVTQIIWRVTSLQTHPSVPCPSIRPRDWVHFSHFMSTNDCSHKCSLLPSHHNNVDANCGRVSKPPRGFHCTVTTHCVHGPRGGSMKTLLLTP